MTSSYFFLNHKIRSSSSEHPLDLGKKKTTSNIIKEKSDIIDSHNDGFELFLEEEVDDEMDVLTTSQDLSGSNLTKWPEVWDEKTWNKKKFLPMVYYIVLRAIKHRLFPHSNLKVLMYQMNGENAASTHMVLQKRKAKVTER